MDQGVSQSEQAAVAVTPSNARTATGSARRVLGTPAERRAVISPSLDIRLRASNTPTRTPIGRVNTSAGGKTRRKR